MEEVASQDAEERPAVGTVGQQTAFAQAAEHKLELALQESGKDRYHRRIRKCNQQVRLDQSRSVRTHGVLQKAPEEVHKLQPIVHWSESVRPQPDKRRY